VETAAGGAYADLVSSWEAEMNSTELKAQATVVNAFDVTGKKCAAAIRRPSLWTYRCRLKNLSMTMESQAAQH
jgi:hypothetical protein